MLHYVAEFLLRPDELLPQIHRKLGQDWKADKAKKNREAILEDILDLKRDHTRYLKTQAGSSLGKIDTGPEQGNVLDKDLSKSGKEDNTKDSDNLVWEPVGDEISTSSAQV